MSLEQARQFLARVVPWPEDGSISWIGVHNTWVPDDAKPGDKPRWSGRACRTVAEAERAVQYALNGKGSRDLYVCMSAQREAQAVTSVGKQGQMYTRYKAVRLAENAVALKSLFLDIDVKEGSGYASLDDAVTSLGNFLRETGLPKPSIMVGSGGGLHVHFVMSRALTPAEWYPLASALITATERHGLKCDTKVTTDAARVLRVPQTLNWKFDPPRPVRIVGKPTDFDYDVDYLSKILTPYKTNGALPSHLGGMLAHIPRRPPLPGLTELSAGIETTMSQADLRACLDAIPNPGTDWNFWNTIGMRCYAATDGADYGLEEWRLWSGKVQTEGKDSVDARWATFHSSPPTRTGAGSLVVQARASSGDTSWRPNVPAAPPPPANDDLPPQYKRDADGVVCLVTYDDAGTPMADAVSDYPMTDPEIQKDPWILHFTTITERGKSQRISVPCEIVGTSDMRRTLQEQGLMLKSEPKMKEFLMSWIKRLQGTKSVIASAPFGWHDNNGTVEGFVYGGKMYTPTGERSAANPDPVLAKQYKPKGTAAPWTAASKLITDQQRPDLNAILASAFAAPLMMFTGHRGAVMSTWATETGIGKSTTICVAQAVWGDPVKATQMLTDTQNSVINKVGEIRSLPMYWDEIKTEADTKKFVDIVFRLSMGKEKSRMTQRVTQREVGQWQTLLVSASNDSILDQVVQSTNTTAAGIARVFEFEITPGVIGQIQTSTAQRIIARLNNNFGHAGLAYAEWLGKNHAQIDKEVETFLSTLETETGAFKDERLWVAVIGTLLLGARYANKLKLTTIDEAALKEFLFEQLDNMRRERQAQTVDMGIGINVSDKLSLYLNAMRQRHTIFTNRIHSGPGKPHPNSIKVVSDISKVDGVYVQAGVGDKRIRISCAHFHQWLHDRKISLPVFKRALERQFKLKSTRAAMAAGVPNHATTSQHVYEIDITGQPLLEDYING